MIADQRVVDACVRKRADVAARGLIFEERAKTPRHILDAERQFIALAADPTRLKIVRNVLALAEDFECQLILEGTEDESSALAAAELGIPFGQGFFFARPADPATFE